MKVGYARVSSDDQNLDLQRDALRLAGCERVYEEKESGGKVDRPELLRLFEALRPGDTPRGLAAGPAWPLAQAPD